MNHLKKSPAMDHVLIKDAHEISEDSAEGNIVNKPKRRKKSSNKFFKALNVFGLIEKDMLIRVMPFIFFLTGLALIYIANSYYAERTIREIDQITKDMKELRSEYISVKSDLMLKSNQSQIANSVLSAGLKESRVAPKKILLIEKTQPTN